MKASVIRIAAVLIAAPSSLSFAKPVPFEPPPVIDPPVSSELFDRCDDLLGAGKAWQEHMECADSFAELRGRLTCGAKGLIEYYIDLDYDFRYPCGGALGSNALGGTCHWFISSFPKAKGAYAMLVPTVAGDYEYNFRVRKRTCIRLFGKAICSPIEVGDPVIHKKFSLDFVPQSGEIIDFDVDVCE